MVRIPSGDPMTSRQLTCPDCGRKIKDGEKCGKCDEFYSELRCPFCDEVVHIISSADDDECPYPCGCVVVSEFDDCYWGNHIEALEFKRKVHGLALQVANTEGGNSQWEPPDEDFTKFEPCVSEVEALCEGDPDVSVIRHDDGGQHGMGFFASFVCVRKK